MFAPGYKGPKGADQQSYQLVNGKPVLQAYQAPYAPPNSTGQTLPTQPATNPTTPNILDGLPGNLSPETTVALNNMNMNPTQPMSNLPPPTLYPYQLGTLFGGNLFGRNK